MFEKLPIIHCPKKIHKAFRVSLLGTNGGYFLTEILEFSRAIHLLFAVLLFVLVLLAFVLKEDVT